MNRLIQMLLHPLHHAPDGDAPMSRGSPPVRTGWPSPAEPEDTQRRSSGVTPWDAKGPFDEWERPPSPDHVFRVGR